MIVRMTNPAAMQLPAVRRLFEAALARGPIDRDHCIELTAASAGHPLLGIFIGLEDGEPRAMLTVKLPLDPKLDRPLFDLAANLGASPGLRDEVLRAAIDFTRAAGYNQANTWNQTGHSDAVYLRRARKQGIKAKHSCSLIELDFKEDPEDGRIK